MKYQFFIFILTLSLAVSAQNKIASLYYYEGTVHITDKSGKNIEAKLNISLTDDLKITTSEESFAEIKWNEGETSVIGPNSKQNLKELRSSYFASKNSKSLKRLFTSGDRNNKEIGGIRRDAIMFDTKDPQTALEIAEAFFTSKQYLKAINVYAFFSNSFPNDNQIPKALFNSSLCYLELNNPIKCKELLTQLIEKFPNSSLTNKAKKIVVKL